MIKCRVACFSFKPFDIFTFSLSFSKIACSIISFFSGYTPGDLLSRINAISAIRKALGNQALLSILQLLFSFVFFVLMMVYDFELAISASVMCPESISVRLLSEHSAIFLAFRVLQPAGKFSTCWPKG